MYTKLWSENLKGRDCLENLDTDGNIRMDLREIGREDMNWMDLA
jgi:hypothetical protein